MPSTSIRCYFFTGDVAHGGADAVYSFDRRGVNSWTPKKLYYSTATHPPPPPAAFGGRIFGFTAGAQDPTIISKQGVVLGFQTVGSGLPVDPEDELMWVPSDVTPTRINTTTPPSNQGARIPGGPGATVLTWQNSQGAWWFNNAWWLIAQANSTMDFAVRVYKNTSADPTLGTWVPQDTAHQPTPSASTSHIVLVDVEPQFVCRWDGISNIIYAAYFLSCNNTTAVINLIEFDMTLGTWTTPHDPLTITSAANETTVILREVMFSPSNSTYHIGIEFLTNPSGSTQKMDLNYFKLSGGSWSSPFTIATATSTLNLIAQGPRMDQWIRDTVDTSIHITWSTNGAVSPEVVTASYMLLDTITITPVATHTFPNGGESVVDCFGRGLLLNGFPCYPFDYQSEPDSSIPPAVWIGGAGHTFSLEIVEHDINDSGTCAYLTYVNTPVQVSKSLPEKVVRNRANFSM